MMKYTARTIALGVAACTLGAASASAQPTANDIWVGEHGSTSPTGSDANQFQSVMAAAGRTKSWPLSNTIVLRSAEFPETWGNFPETFTLDPDAIPDEFGFGGPITLTTNGDGATIGRVAGRNKVDFRIMSFNTHLFGDCAGPPSLEDDARAEAIFNNGISTLNPNPDVILLQEVWQFSLADRLADWAADAGYPYAYGSERGVIPISCFGGGLMIISKTELSLIEDLEYDSGFEAGNKGWLRATTVKDGQIITIYNTHTEADYDDWEERQEQVSELAGRINQWQDILPASAFFAGGDFNTAGLADQTPGLDPSNCTQDFNIDPFGTSCWEYHSGLAARMNAAQMNDAQRNSLGFYSPDYSTDPIFSASRVNDLHRLWSPSVNSELLDYIFYGRAPARDPIRPHIVPKGFFIHPMLDGTGWGNGDIYTHDISDHYAVVADFTILGPVAVNGELAQPLLDQPEGEFNEPQPQK
jgi:endonuclease/exonuclease/phosphatase family metal-dependent hydrolase